MTKIQIDQLFQTAEKLSQDFSLFPSPEDHLAAPHVRGLLTRAQIDETCEYLAQLDIDQYIQEVVTPSESSQRISARALIQKLCNNRIISEYEDGPLYVAEVELDFGNTFRRVGFIGQNRESRNGAWMPHHHKQAARAARDFAKHAFPVVTLIDTPGADAGEEANTKNQAHSISRLIAEMSNLDVPTVGIILGAGYSGGAIPLATTNVLLSVRDGIFNTIQPQGLASIARKYNLSWQECAKYVGVSAFELMQRNVVDGIVDYAPGDRIDKLQNLVQAICTSIEGIEMRAENFARENPYMMEHYQQSVMRYLRPSARLASLQKGSTFQIAQSPTEHANVFRLTYRYLRYLTLRSRLQSTTLRNYSRVTEKEIPEGQLAERMDREKRKKFQQWLQSPDKVLYDDQLNKLWKNYNNKLEERSETRGKIKRMIFGGPEENYLRAKQELCFGAGMYLYNRWKADADINFAELISFLNDYQQNRFLLKQDDLIDAAAVLGFIKKNEHPLANHINKNLEYATKAMIAEQGKGKIPEELQTALIQDLNNILRSKLLSEKIRNAIRMSPNTQQLINSVVELPLEANRRLLEDALAPHIAVRSETDTLPADNKVTILDVILLDDLHSEFLDTCHNMLIFGSLYDYIIEHLVDVAREARETHNLSRAALKKLMEKGLSHATKRHQLDGQEEAFGHWFKYFIAYSSRGELLKQIEEWKKHSFPRISDTLFVIITFLFEKLLPEYYAAENGKDYSGRINPVSIGRRKDFWNRLTIAYYDLLIQDVLDKTKKQKLTGYKSFISEFFTEFEELNGQLMTSDPVGFPGFRTAIESALKKGIPACGVVTGFGTVRINGQAHRVGTLISNLDFQAGAFDMASAEKFCKLMVECARHQYPIVCFVSSGGMQTKEGAAALFSMAVVNDRITRFIRDNDLPIIVFGFGDCTGGAQASFATHPLVQNYYFSGTNMPFAGQIVVPSYLPSTATLSNYLSTNNESMSGLVKHPFEPELDNKLQAIDPTIPVAKRTVLDVLERVLQDYDVVDDEHVAAEETQPKKLFRPVKKVLIHARGCTAQKLVKKAQESDLQVILVQSDPDMNSTAADMLNEKGRLVCIGGNTPDESYLNAKSVIRIADLEGADALHPGIGFLSESAQFAALCANHNINFVGPHVSSMETMGNKSNAINTALRIGVPVVPGSHGIVTTSAMAAKVADSIGYPVLLKAVHGGGGKGIQVVESPDNIHELFHQISAEARSAFGNGDVYLEKYVTSLRHIEVQILRDSHNNTRVLGLRDCSVQRNNQKIVEESGSTMLPAELAQQAYDYAAAIADAVEYYGAGTVEFIFDLDANTLYFMEMNTRLQVEHPVTELVTNTDIVKHQFRIAAGESIEEVVFQENGYAMEVRVNAEKAVNRNGQIVFVPNPGKVTECKLPAQDYIHLLQAIDTDKEVTPFYDSMVVQIICYGKDRADTVKKLRKYLDSVVIKGVCTNIPLLKRILDDEIFNKGIYSTGYLPDFLNRIDTDLLIRDIEASAGNQQQAISLDALRIEGSDEIKVLAPASSIFYGSPSPTEPAYVTEGDTISTEQTLCLMEAMKMFTPLSLRSLNPQGNELYPAGQQYQVVKVLNSDGQQVNQGDLLFVLRPLSGATSDVNAEPLAAAG
ncbi:MAG: ATP-grasp domain-containing protein [Oceanospirillaceae bacterium]|nr:ATP-grasp domain-containing protein [Oceanospirillaceae bacterium]MCP5334821.1 ATP-grasp domain-containing protein [Oceanospirillaceae bacterium]MCP5349492.1 ATP-grasp domain-containing protein [Oceanospirillaceae bacterium]